MYNDDDRQPIDEYTLAAFLSGTLPEERRRQVIAYLSDNAEVRDLLCMAHEALDSARAPVVEPFTPPDAAPVQEMPVSETPQRQAPARTPHPAFHFLHLQSVRRVAAAVVAVLVLGLGLHFGLRSNGDGLRGGSPAEAKLVVRVSTPALQFQWNEISEAYYYHVVIWDTQAAKSVAQHETRSTRLGRDDAFILSLRTKLVAGRTYSVRVDAVDVQNRLILKSQLVDFFLPD